MKKDRLRLLLILSMALCPAIGCGLLDAESSSSSSGVDTASARVERPPAPPSSERAPTTSAAELRELFDSRSSGVMVEIEGSVDRLLRDDNEGRRHQKFIVRVGNRTVLIAHNIDLAPRAPVEQGDPVRIRGQYEWNDRGGVVHWTHHDPKGYREGGWIQVGGETYR